MLVKYVAIFTLFTFSFLFLFAIVSYKKLTSPFASASSVTSTDIKNEDVFVLSFFVVDDFDSEEVQIKAAYKIFMNIKNKVANVYKVNNDTQIDVPGKYAYEPMSKIMWLGMSINDNQFEKGLEMADQTMQNLFGYASDRYIVVDEGVAPTAEDLFLKGRTNIPLDLEFINTLSNSIETDLTASEVYYLYGFMTSLPSGSIKISDIADAHVKNTNLIDTEVKEITFDSSVAVEKKSIAVLNGSSTPGLANFGARIVTNLGGRVISVDNSTNKFEQSVLIVDDKSSDSVRQIQKFFNVPKVVEKGETDLYENEIIRADIVLILGLDMENRL